jgi:hypothetical protein
LGARVSKKFQNVFVLVRATVLHKIDHNGNRIDITLGDPPFTPPQIRLRNTIIAA